MCIRVLGACWERAESVLANLYLLQVHTRQPRRSGSQADDASSVASSGIGKSSRLASRPARAPRAKQMPSIGAVLDEALECKRAQRSVAAQRRQARAERRDDAPAGAGDVPMTPIVSRQASGVWLRDAYVSHTHIYSPYLVQRP